MLKAYIKKNLPGIVMLKNIVLDKVGKKISPKKYKAFLEKWYKWNTGETLDLDNPLNYTQKIQWLKLYDSTQIKADLSDKYKVREWVQQKIGDEYLIPLIAGGIHDANDIDFDSLPQKFVIKTNHSSGWNIIVKDKSSIDKKRIIKQLNTWLKLDFSFMSGLELHYGLIEPCILIEQYVETANEDLQDYKFLCFDGEPKYCWVDIGRFSEHQRVVYDMNWNKQSWNQYRYKPYEGEIEKPQNFEKMIELARTLAQGFNHVRVDFYNVDGKIYFGEMTFTNGSGKELIYPDSANRMLGELLRLPNKRV